MFCRVITLTTLSLFMPFLAYAQKKSENEVKFNARFKTLSFAGNIPDIVYLEGKEYKSVDIYENTLSSEKTYVGGQVIEFFKVVMEKPPTESEIARSKLNDVSAKEAKIGDEYNRLLSEMSAYARTIPDPDSPTPAQKARLYEFQSALDELKLKIDEARQNTYNETQRMYAAERAERETVNVSNAKQKTPIEAPKPRYEPFAKFTIPAAGGSYILIFNKTPNGVALSPLNDSPGAFPFGSYQFFNFAGSTVELRFGSKVISLSPNSRTVFKPETSNGDYLEGEFWTKVDDSFKLGYKFRNLHISRVRTMAFIMPTTPGESALNLKIAEERGQPELQPRENEKEKTKNSKSDQPGENKTAAVF